MKPYTVLSKRTFSSVGSSVIIVFFRPTNKEISKDAVASVAAFLRARRCDSRCVKVARIRKESRLFTCRANPAPLGTKFVAVTVWERLEITDSPQQQHTDLNKRPRVHLNTDS